MTDEYIGATSQQHAVPGVAAQEHIIITTYLCSKRRLMTRSRGLRAATHHAIATPCSASPSTRRTPISRPSAAVWTTTRCHT